MTRTWQDEEGRVWFGCEFVPEPSAMSELGKWIKEEKAALEYQQALDRLSESMSQLFKPAPKKLTWWQKIRRYDDLQARCNSAESMRDHYKTIMSEALRDRDLHARVADNWQAKLIDKNTIIGKRLKFIVGNNRVEIIIGNPVTACYFTEPDNGDNVYVDRFLDVSICHKNDQFDWKRGVVEALENMICNWLGTAYGEKQDYYNALFTAYPEIGIQPVVNPVKKTKKAKK